jgi:RNA polymerase sigma-70 factor (ECF subfamily)
MSDRDNSEDLANLKRLMIGGHVGEKALEQLYRAHRRGLLAFVRSLGLDMHSAEDVVQNVFLQVAKKADTFRGECAVSSWIFGMARNAAMDVFRKGGKEVRLDDEGWEHISNTRPADLVCPLQPDPRKALQECFDQAYKAFRKAHPAAADLIYQSLEHDWDTNAMAQFLGRTAGAAREYLSQCKKKLKQFVEPCKELLGALP